MDAVNQYHQVVEDLQCNHSVTELCFKTSISNVRTYFRQCMACGEPAKRIQKRFVTTQIEMEAKPFDKDLQQRYWQSIHAEYQRRREQQVTQNREDWFEWYNQYLNTPQWREKRERVLERDNYLCQGCRVNQATQVHHLTYERIGNEMLFDLIAVCNDCHKRVHDPEKIRVIILARR